MRPQTLMGEISQRSTSHMTDDSTFREYLRSELRRRGFLYFSPYMSNDLPEYIKRHYSLAIYNNIYKNQLQRCTVYLAQYVFWFRSSHKALARVNLRIRFSKKHLNKRLLYLLNSLLRKKIFTLRGSITLTRITPWRCCSVRV